MNNYKLHKYNKFKNNKFYPLMEESDEEEDLSILNKQLSELKICREFLSKDINSISYNTIENIIIETENKIKNINLSISTNDKNLKRKVEEIENENLFKKHRNQGCGIYF